jgi:hypothetical protein
MINPVQILVRVRRVSALQLGVRRPGGRGAKEGWAWIASGEGLADNVIEAYRLSDFVKNTLRNVVRPPGRSQS